MLLIGQGDNSMNVNGNRPKVRQWSNIKRWKKFRDFVYNQKSMKMHKTVKGKYKKKCAQYLND